MTQLIGEKIMQQKLILTPTKNLQNNKLQAKITTSPPQTPPLFRHFEKNIVLFAYTKEADEDPPSQIMVLQQTKKHYKLSEEQKVVDMFRNLNLEGTTEKLFLTKIDPLEHKQIAKQIEQMLQVSNNYSRQDRLERRKQIFEASRTHKLTQELASEEVMAKRKIRLVKMDSLIQGGAIKGIVELGGKSVEYEDLSLMSQNQNYYALIRKKVNVDQVFPQVNIEEKYLNNIDFEAQTFQQQKYQNDDQYDSNDSQNSAFDYPEEEDSRSSQEIIRDYDQMDYQPYENQEDEEELYRRYLRRQRRKEHSMKEQPQYLYEEYD